MRVEKAQRSKWTIIRSSYFPIIFGSDYLTVDWALALQNKREAVLTDLDFCMMWEARGLRERWRSGSLWRLHRLRSNLHTTRVEQLRHTSVQCSIPTSRPDPSVNIEPIHVWLLPVPLALCLGPTDGCGFRLHCKGFPLVFRLIMGAICTCASAAVFRIWILVLGLFC